MAKKKQKSQFFKSLKPSKQTKEVRGNWLVFKFGSRGLWFESRWLAKFQIVYLVFDLLSLWMKDFSGVSYLPVKFKFLFASELFYN